MNTLLGIRYRVVNNETFLHPLGEVTINKKAYNRQMCNDVL